MQDLDTLRRNFRNGIIADVLEIMNKRLGAINLPVRIVDVVLPLGSRDTVLAGGEDQFLRLSLNGHGSILSWSLGGLRGGAPTAGSCTVDVLRGTSLGTLTSVCPSNPPSLTAQTERTEQPPTGWATDLPDPSWIFIRATAVDGVLEQVSLTLKVAVAAAATSLFVADTTGAFFTDDTGAAYTLEP